MNIRLVDFGVDISFAADPEISILAAAEKAGRNEITAGCRGGGADYAK